MEVNPANQMYFPHEIWNLIMSHFHSIYKKPFHYEAIMKVSEFYFCVVHHRESYKHGAQWNRLLRVDSYYMRLVLYSDYETNHLEKTHQIRLKRGAGAVSKKICEDFVDIFKDYKNNSLTNVFNNISYI
jgi:hypothetical protein